MALSIEPLNRKHVRKDFCCGKESLDRYIRQQASQDVRKKAATVFVLVDVPSLDVLAYYTLSTFSVGVTDLDPRFVRRLPRYPILPAILIGRLAVDASHRGKGFGSLMLADALKRVLKTTEQIASTVVLVEALDEDAASFYEKFGFQRTMQTPLMLYLPVKKIKQFLESN